MRFNHYHLILVNLIGLITIAASIFFLSWSGWALALAMFVLFQGVGISATYHRYYSHKSFEFRSEWMRKLCTLFGLMAGQGSHVSWAAVHKAHHKSADTHDDPHSPIHGLVRGFLWMEWEPHDIRMAVSLLRDSFNKFLYNYSVPVFFSYWLLLHSTGGLWLLVSAGILPAGLSILCSNLGNHLAHSYGYRTYETKSEDKNNWLIALIFFGEGWHNNHHAKPNEYSFQHKWWEIDIGGLMIKYILRR